MMYFFFFEVWKDIEGYEGVYQISNEGNVFNTKINRCLKVGKKRNLHYVNLYKGRVGRNAYIEHLLEQYFPELYPKQKKRVEDLPGEIWKDIRGFEGKYQCSNKGRVKTLSRSYWAGLDYTCLRHIEEAILKPCVSKRGYLRVDLRTGSAEGHCQKWVHNLVARTFYDNYDMSLVPNHIDGVKTNNCIENLELVTQKENIHHAVRTGLKRMYGEDNTASLLTNCQAKEIRIAHITGARYKELAACFGVGIHVIRGVIQNLTYKDENYQYKDGQGSYIQGT